MRNAMRVLVLADGGALVGVYSSVKNAVGAASLVEAETRIEEYPLDDHGRGDRPRQTLYRTCEFAGRTWLITAVKPGSDGVMRYDLVRDVEDPTMSLDNEEHRCNNFQF